MDSVLISSRGAGQEAGVRDQQFDQVEEAVRKEVRIARAECQRGIFFLSLAVCSALLDFFSC
jgi:hypothetical protein